MREIKYRAWNKEEKKMAIIALLGYLESLETLSKKYE